MAIIVIDNRKVIPAPKVDFKKVKLEDFLQASIADNPEVLGLKGLDETLRMLVLGTEFDRIDILAIDQYGKIYIIETKLFKNDDKREVVAQVVDYGACLWGKYGADTPEATKQFWSRVDQKIRERSSGVGLDETLKKFISSLKNEVTDETLGGALRELKANIEHNLCEGNFRYVVAMDRLPDDIKSHITFLNRVTKDDFWVLGVELEFYRPEKYDGLQIVVPTVFGSEPRQKRSGKSGTRWSEETFFESLDKLNDKELRDAVADLYKFTKNKSVDDPWQGLITRPRFSFFVTVDGKVFSLFRVTVDNTRGRVTIAFYLLQHAEWRGALEKMGLVSAGDPAHEKEVDFVDVAKKIGLDGFKKVVEEVWLKVPAKPSE